jgi:hypothetical protein
MIGPARDRSTKGCSYLMSIRHGMAALIVTSAVLISACSAPNGHASTVPNVTSAGHVRAVKDLTTYPTCDPNADPNCGTPPLGGVNPDATPCTAAGSPYCDTTIGYDPFGPLRGPSVPPWYTPQCGDVYGYGLNHAPWHQCYSRMNWVP